MQTCIGLISDTHGHLDPRAVSVFEQAQVDAILHAGDIGPASILHELELIAPVTAVLGNNDTTEYLFELKSLEFKRFNNVRIQLVHNIKHATFDSESDVIVCGHVHRPLNKEETNTGILVVNPGSATSSRVPGGPTVALLDVSNSQMPTAQIIRLEEFEAAINCSANAK